jgi:beta-glucanase (GH16 family)
MKMHKTTGFWGAFWMMCGNVGKVDGSAVSGVEIDIIESGERPRNGVNHALHWDGYGADHKSISKIITDAEQYDGNWHTYALQWTEEEYIFYIDGKETWRCSEAVSQREQFILVSTECMGYRWLDVLTGEILESSTKPAEILKKAVLPDAFIVDYVRVYDEVKD